MIPQHISCMIHMNICLSIVKLFLFFSQVCLTQASATEIQTYELFEAHVQWSVDQSHTDIGSIIKCASLCLDDLSCLSFTYYMTPSVKSADCHLSNDILHRKQ